MSNVTPHLIFHVASGFMAAKHLFVANVPDGARLLLVDTWTDPTHTRPLVPVLMAGRS